MNEKTMIEARRRDGIMLQIRLRIYENTEAPPFRRI